MAFIIPKKTNNTPVIELTASQATSQAPEPVTKAAAALSIPATPVSTTPATSQVVIETQQAPATSQLDMLIQVNLEALTKKLETAIPDIRTEMITIHKALAKDPAQVTILSPDECATIFAGYSKLSGIELVAKAAAKKGSKTPVSIEMFE